MRQPFRGRHSGPPVRRGFFRTTGSVVGKIVGRVVGAVVDGILGAFGS